MIATSALTVRFRRGLRRRAIRALDQVSLEIRASEFFALVGRNGAGKSTFVHCLLGLLRPTAGAVRVMGDTPAPGAPLFERVAYLPEEPHYHGYLTVGEALDYYGRLLKRRPDPKRAASLVERFGLGTFLDRRVSKCSKGMKQKLGLAQCLLGEPALLLLDEPMRGLDPMTVRELRDALLERHREGVTIVMNSHMLAEIEMVATRVAMLENGRVIADGALRDLLTVDSGQYQVECDAMSEVPEYFTADARADGFVKGALPADRLYEFMAFVQARGGRLRTCALKSTSLEDSFIARVETARA